MKAKNILLLVAAAAVMLVIILIISSRRPSYYWGMHDKPEKTPSQPYGINHVDEYFARSLDNGYETRVLPAIIVPGDISDYLDPYMLPGGIRALSNRYDYIPAIAEAPIDTSLIVIQRADWYQSVPRGIQPLEAYEPDDGEEYDETVHNVEEEGDPYYIPRPNIELDPNLYPTLSLLEFARRGGHAVYVETPHKDYSQWNWPIDKLLERSVGDAADVRFHEHISSGADRYDKQWLLDIKDQPRRVKTRDGYVTINDRFAPLYIALADWQVSDFNLGNIFPEDVVVNRLLTYNSYYDKEEAYAVEFLFPETGGRLVVTSLSLYFTNLGLTLDGGPEVIEEIMRGIDDRPVARLDYVNPRSKRHGSSSGIDDDSTLFAVIERNPSLSLAWMLFLAALICAFAGGLMRRHPVSHGFAADDLDKTDIVAAREYKFRKSPLLHFLFQCSWLYKKDSDYRELFDVNYRKVARIVSSALNTELLSADDVELKAIASHFASYQHRPAAEIYDDLAWLNEVNRDYNAEVSFKQFKRSQEIAEAFGV